MITLYSALALFSANGGGEGLIRKIVVFEPPLLLDDFAAFSVGQRVWRGTLKRGKLLKRSLWH
jgi:hypothetical protein